MNKHRQSTEMEKAPNVLFEKLNTKKIHIYLERRREKEAIQENRPKFATTLIHIVKRRRHKKQQQKKKKNVDAIAKKKLIVLVKMLKYEGNIWCCFWLGATLLLPKKFFAMIATYQLGG